MSIVAISPLAGHQRSVSKGANAMWALTETYGERVVPIRAVRVRVLSLKGAQKISWYSRCNDNKCLL